MEEAAHPKDNRALRVHDTNSRQPGPLASSERHHSPGHTSPGPAPREDGGSPGLPQASPCWAAPLPLLLTAHRASQRLPTPFQVGLDALVRAGLLPANQFFSFKAQ